MKQEEKLKKYCKKMLLDVDISNNILTMQNLRYKILDEDEKLFDEDFEFLPTLDENDHNIYGYIYEFCGRWYLQKGEEEVTMTELKNIGKAVQKLPTNSFIGIHSGNEMLDGIGSYKQWIEKAKFLGVQNLGICEKNTLAGVIEFQNLCKKNSIKPIFGTSFRVKNELGEYEVKIYIKNFQGWQNALKFNEILNVFEKVYIDEKLLLQNQEGLFIIIDTKSSSFHIVPKELTHFQLDTVVFDQEDVDKEYLNNLESYLTSNLEPVCITDAYTIEQEDYIAREILWGIAKKFNFKSKNQYFKSNDEYARELISMFECQSWIEFFKRGMANLEYLVKNCNFEYNTVDRRLPKYTLSEEESKLFKDKDELFLHLIKKGFRDRNIKDIDKYMSRLKEELRVLKKGDVIDYFLVLHDIIGFAKREGILLGVGRGSAGGSLVSYLLGIIQIDPLEFDLLFERFLNDGRMGEIVECKAYEIELEDGKIIKLNEGSLVKVLRNKEERIIFIEDLIDSDEIIKYN